MNYSDIHFSSKNQKWETPQWFFDDLNSIFKFNLDCCAEESTAKCFDYFTEDDNALMHDWVGVVWCNPPYGKFQKDFIKKAYEESLKGSTVVCLIPARPETKLWQDLIFKHASSVTFIKGRLKFGGSKDNAPFPSAIVVFGKTSNLSHLGRYFEL